MPQKFRKKPVEIEAIQHTGTAENMGEIAEWMTRGGHGAKGFFRSNEIHIETLEGTMVAGIGDWIIKGVKGEFYPCKPDIFADTYDPVEESDGR